MNNKKVKNSTLYLTDLKNILIGKKNNIFDMLREI